MELTLYNYTFVYVEVVAAATWSDYYTRILFSFCCLNLEKYHSKVVLRYKIIQYTSIVYMHNVISWLHVYAMRAFYDFIVLLSSQFAVYFLNTRFSNCLIHFVNKFNFKKSSFALITYHFKIKWNIYYCNSEFLI